jgi:nitrate/nitrite transporter NarK
MGIGGVLAGWLSDRIGRVRVTWCAVLIFTICTGVIGICDAYWQIALMRFFSGFGLSAVYSIGTLLAAEYVPTRIRTTVLATRFPVRAHATERPGAARHFCLSMTFPLGSSVSVRPSGVTGLRLFSAHA